MAAAAPGDGSVQRFIAEPTLIKPTAGPQNEAKPGGSGSVLLLAVSTDHEFCSVKSSSAWCKQALLDPSLLVSEV